MVHEAPKIVSTWYRWADTRRRHGMLTMAMLERRGWVRVAPHPRFPGSWLMRKEGS